MILCGKCWRADSWLKAPCVGVFSAWVRVQIKLSLCKLECIFFDQCVVELCRLMSSPFLVFVSGPCRVVSVSPSRDDAVPVAGHRQIVLRWQARSVSVGCFRVVIALGKCFLANVSLPGPLHIWHGEDSLWQNSGLLICQGIQTAFGYRFIICCIWQRHSQQQCSLRLKDTEELLSWNAIKKRQTRVWLL